jgi:CheY-like chemotaxis protein
MTIAAPKSTVTCQTLEDFWRTRVEETQARYHQATEHHRSLLQELSEETPLDPNGALALASQVESEALAEHTRALRAFTDLTLNGETPEERAGSNRVVNFDSATISIVDDDESIRKATRALLRSVGYHVETFASAELFLESDGLRESDCLVLDVRMPGIDGLELQRRLNAAQSHVPIIFVTAHDDKLHRVTAMDAGAADFFHKPFDAGAFVAAVQAALQSRSSCEASQPETPRAPLSAKLVPL